MALMCLVPLSEESKASFPQVLESSCRLPVPNPILESGLTLSFSLLPRKPILSLEESVTSPKALSPSLLQLYCNEASNQRLPRVTLQRSGAVLLVSDQ